MHAHAINRLVKRATEKAWFVLCCATRLETIQWFFKIAMNYSQGFAPQHCFEDTRSISIGEREQRQLDIVLTALRWRTPVKTWSRVYKRSIQEQVIHIHGEQAQWTIVNLIQYIATQRAPPRKMPHSFLVKKKDFKKALAVQFADRGRRVSPIFLNMNR